MQRKQVILSIIAVVLVAISLLVHCRGEEEDWKPPALGLAALAALKPDRDGDMAILDHLRSLGAIDLADWKSLPGPGRHLFATLWVEEVHHTGDWGQMTEVDPAESSGPTLGDAADSYDALGIPATGKAVRQLAIAFDRDRAAILAWIQALRDGRQADRPLAKDTSAAAKAAFARLDAVRARRLEYLREHAAELGIR